MNEVTKPLDKEQFAEDSVNVVIRKQGKVYARGYKLKGTVEANDRLADLVAHSLKNTLRVSSGEPIVDVNGKVY